jgi:hypothetical protein
VKLPVFVDAENSIAVRQREPPGRRPESAQSKTTWSSLCSNLSYSCIRRFPLGSCRTRVDPAILCSSQLRSAAIWRRWEDWFHSDQAPVAPARSASRGLHWTAYFGDHMMGRGAEMECCARPWRCPSVQLFLAHWRVLVVPASPPSSSPHSDPDYFSSQKGSDLSRTRSTTAFASRIARPSSPVRSSVSFATLRQISPNFPCASLLCRRESASFSQGMGIGTPSARAPCPQRLWRPPFSVCRAHVSSQELSRLPLFSSYVWPQGL